MGAIKINGSTSGSTTITAPATGSDETIELSTALAAKAPSASPTFTGTVALPSTTTLDGSTLNLPGMVLVTSDSFSAVSAVNINSCFTSTYANYRLVVALNADTQRQISMRLRASAADNTTSNYFQGSPGHDSGGNNRAIAQASATAFTFSWASAATSRFSLGLDVFNPQASVATQGSGALIGVDTSSTNFQGNSIGLAFNATTQFDGFSIYPAAGTITGNIRVYGYRD